MKKLVALFLLLSIFGFAQKAEDQVAAIEKFQTDLNDEYRSAEESPLRGDNFTNFKEHTFFPIDMEYRVQAKFQRSENARPFDFPTSSGKTQPYIEFGTATFEIKGKSFTLRIYQNLNLMKVAGYENYLFLPFRDETNSKETYGGGKYIDLRIPESNEIVIDFNQSYQPYCAYNAYDYNCPIVPSANFLPAEIRAGVKYEDVYHH